MTIEHKTDDRADPSRIDLERRKRAERVLNLRKVHYDAITGIDAVELAEDVLALLARAERVDPPQVQQAIADIQRRYDNQYLSVDRHDVGYLLAALKARADVVTHMLAEPVPPTIATDDQFRDVYTQGYRHALNDVLKRLADAGSRESESTETRLRMALIAARQFLDPEISRGPDVNGWANTVALVDEALEADAGSREPQQELVAFVKKLAAIKTCDDEPNRCESDSGPYCATHLFDRWIVNEARKVLRAARPVSREPDHG